jgi:hypothetical protein
MCGMKLDRSAPFDEREDQSHDDHQHPTTPKTKWPGEDEDLERDQLPGRER